MRVSAFRRYLDESAAPSRGADHAAVVAESVADGGPAALRAAATAAPTCWRCWPPACAMRARSPMHLQCGDRVLPLTAFPRERLVHCPSRPATSGRDAVARAAGAAGRAGGAQAARRPRHRPDRRAAVVPAAGAAAVGAGAARPARRTAARGRRRRVYRVSPAFDLSLAAGGPLRDTLRYLRRGGEPARDRRLAGLRPRQGDAARQRAVPAVGADRQPLASGGVRRLSLAAPTTTAAAATQRTSTAAAAAEPAGRAALPRGCAAQREPSASQRSSARSSSSSMAGSRSCAAFSSAGSPA